MDTVHFKYRLATSVEIVNAAACSYAHQVRKNKGSRDRALLFKRRPSGRPSIGEAGNTERALGICTDHDGLGSPAQ